MNNSDKFRFVGATAMQSITCMIPNCQANQYQQIQKEKSLDEGSLIGSYEFLTLKDYRVCKNNHIVKWILFR